MTYRYAKIHRTKIRTHTNEEVTDRTVHVSTIDAPSKTTVFISYFKTVGFNRYVEGNNNKKINTILQNRDLNSKNKFCVFLFIHYLKCV
jgi:phage terminase large subunit